jgi:Transcriptional regulator, AbiEi antitoxin, Type IV TA system/Transcriptional regulator, AbiEi antitoxin N-terminal domain
MQNRSMATTKRTKLNALYSGTTPGAPLTSEDLAALGISADLAVHYVRAGWLVRLARGVFSRTNDMLALHPSLVLLQRRIEGLHVGGKSALDWYGVRQYLSQQPLLHLVGWDAGRLPDWFTQRFPAEYHRKRLFEEQPGAQLHVAPFEQRSGAPRVSLPERALLEVLSDVGVRQPLQEARELAESSYNLRADVLRELLKRCTSVKTVRLCLQFGRELSLPWATKLDPADLPTGSDRAWVSRSAEGLLVLKP